MLRRIPGGARMDVVLQMMKAIIWKSVISTENETRASCRPLFLNVGSCCAEGRQHRGGGCITPQAVTHSLVLLKMGKIISRNMLS